MSNRRQILQLALTLAAPMPVLAQAPNDIVVAQIAPFTVLPSPDATELNEGMTAAFSEFNSRGGIGGRRIELLTLDDTYSYDGFKARLNDVMLRKPVALLNPVGSAALKGVLDNGLLDKNDVIILNAVPGASVLRDPGHPKLFHIRAGDEQQIQKVVAHARSLTIKSMGVLYIDNIMGTSGLAAAKSAARGAGGAPLKITEARATAAWASIEAGAKTIAAARPESVLVIGSPRFMGEGVKALRAAGVSQQLFTLSYLSAEAMQRIAGAGARGVAIAQTFPNPGTVKLPLLRAFHTSMKARHPSMKAYTPFHLEGYVTARVFIEAVRIAKTITPAGVAEALRARGKIDLGGYSVNFGAGNVGSTWVDLSVVNAKGHLSY